MARRATPRPPIVIRLPREALYAAILVTFLFAAAETVLRVKHALTGARRGARPYSIRSVTQSGVTYAHDDGQLALVLDPHLVYRFAPGQKTAVVTINGDGFRGGEWRREKRAGTRRVAVLGGSSAFGVGASADDRVFTALLETDLDARARARGERVEVWNAGVIGYDSSQELVLLTTDLVHREPDLVVLFDGWNDFNASATLPERYAEVLHPKFCEIDVLLGRRQEVVLEVVRRLHLFQSLEDGALRWSAKLRPVGELGRFTDRSATAAPRYARNLRAMIRLARGFGAAALVAPQPELFHRRDPTPAEQRLRAKKVEEGYGPYARAAYPKFVAAARDVAAAESAPFLDCTPAFDGVPDVAFTDCVHFDDGAHAQLARFLAPAVAAALGW